MKDLWICQKWKMKNVGSTLSEIIEVGGKRTVWHEHRIKHLSENVWCLYQALQIVGGVKSVIDLCAGIGLWAKVIEQEIKPLRLTLIDLDYACCERLKTQFPTADVLSDNYWNISCRGYDLVCMDVTISTAHRIFDNNPDIPLMKVLGEGVTWIIISDCAAPKLHLNKKSYENVLKGEIDSYEDYIRLYSKRLLNKTGKSIHTVFLSGGSKRPHSSYFLIKNDARDFEIKRVENVPESSFYRGDLLND